MKILLADDHSMVRLGLKLLLKRLHADAVIVEAQDYPQALNACAQHQDLDLILLDRMMPGMDGRLGLGSLREGRPDVPIVILSASEDTAHVWESLEAGARGYIPKSSTEEIIQNALQLILAGGTYLPPILIAHHQEAAESHVPQTANLSAQHRGTPPPHLTTRQIEVLKWLVKGRSNKQIAKTLNISEATVCAHVNAIFKTLGVNNRTEAVYAASLLGLSLS